MIRRLAIVLPLLLAGCNPNTLKIDTQPVQQQVIQPSEPRAPKLNNVHWKVVTKSTLDAFIKDLEKAQGSDNPVFVAITMQDYQVLSLGMAELKRYIDQQHAIIVYYKSATNVEGTPLAK